MTSGTNRPQRLSRSRKANEPKKAVLKVYLRTTVNLAIHQWGWAAIIEKQAVTRWTCMLELSGKCAASSAYDAAPLAAASVLQQLTSREMGDADVTVLSPQPDMSVFMPRFINAKEYTGKPEYETVWRNLREECRKREGSTSFEWTSRGGFGSKPKRNYERLTELMNTELDKAPKRKPEVLGKTSCPMCDAPATIYTFGGLCHRSTCGHRWDPANAPTFEEWCADDL